MSAPSANASPERERRGVDKRAGEGEQGRGSAFSISRYFALSTAPILLAAIAVVGYLAHYNAVQDLVDHAENHNISLALSVSDAIWSQHGAFLDSAAADGGVTPDRPERRDIDEVLRPLSVGLGVLKAKIYALDGTTLYSSEPREIGRNRNDDDHPEVFLSAARDGVAQSALTYKDRFSAFSGEVFGRDVVETYVPVVRNSGIVAVFELYSDVTDIKNRIDRTIVVVVAGCLAAFVFVYGMLVLVVMRRAIAPLNRASAEAASIGASTPDVRLSVEGIPAEIRPLVDSVNGALDRLDGALEAQRRFTADAAHELLTPIAVLRANLDTLEAPETAKALRHDVETLSGIVTELLELAEYDAMAPEQGVAVELREACAEIVSTVAPLAYAGGKAIALTGRERPLYVRCCPKFFGRALRNLVDNAIAHTPPGTTVEVEIGETGAVRVIDQGPGIPVDQRDLVFRRFWRGPDTNRPGTGLGLSIVKRFVDIFGGSVEVTDTPGGGATFVLTLPLAKGE